VESTTSNPPTPAQNPPNLEWTDNSSYLVFRRLRQDVKGFWDFATTQAAKQRQSVDLFSAKLIGRYQSGAPLEGAENAPETLARRTPTPI
jgi:deferrochelatase/peroxidase EfeB